MSQTFYFSSESHTYSINGREVPACTRILAEGGLVSFDFVDRDVLERKSELGTEVHKACHLFNTRRKFVCDPKVEGYLNSWEEFSRLSKFFVRLSEHQQIASVNGMDYGMQIDVEGDLRGEQTIIDYKIGEIAPHHGIQLAGYAAGLYHPGLETPIGRFRSRKRIALKLQENGSLAKIHRFEDKSDFDVFVSSLFVTYWKQKHGKFYKGSSQ